MDTPLDAANLVDIQHFKTIITRRVEAFVYAYEVSGFVLTNPSLALQSKHAWTRLLLDSFGIINPVKPL
jgi:hypothetical protein